MIVTTKIKFVKWYLHLPTFQVLVPIANGTEEMEAVIVIDILRRAKANVVVASLEDKLEIVASRKVKLDADMLLDEAAKLSYDLIVLPVSGLLTFVIVINHYVLFWLCKYIPIVCRVGLVVPKLLQTQKSW